MITRMQQKDFILTELLSIVLRCQADVGVLSFFITCLLRDSESVAHTPASPTLL